MLNGVLGICLNYCWYLKSGFTTYYSYPIIDPKKDCLPYIRDQIIYVGVMEGCTFHVGAGRVKMTHVEDLED